LQAVRPGRPWEWIRPRQRGHSDSPAVSPTCRPGACTPPGRRFARNHLDLLAGMVSTTSPRSRVPITHSRLSPSAEIWELDLLRQLQQPHAAAEDLAQGAHGSSLAFCPATGKMYLFGGCVQAATVLWAWTTCGSGTGPPGRGPKATCALLPARTRRWPTTVPQVPHRVWWPEHDSLCSKGADSRHMGMELWHSPVEPAHLLPVHRAVGIWLLIPIAVRCCSSTGYRSTVCPPTRSPVLRKSSDQATQIWSGMAARRPGQPACPCLPRARRLALARC